MVRKFDVEMPKSLTEIVAARLRQAIIDGEFALGELISEESLAASFGVSRTPVRDALTLLQHTGLVQIRPKRGSFVYSPNEDDVREICDFRIILEMQALRRAHAVDRSATAQALQALYADMQAAAHDNDAVRYGRLDLQFHEAFFAHADNRYLAEAYGLVTGKIGALRTGMSQQFSNAREVSLAEHRSVIDLFTQGDFDGLQSLLAEHIGRTLDAFRLASTSGQLGSHHAALAAKARRPLRVAD
ncbi:MAG: HTH-type transcriptional repressor RspR [Paracidovorax wautersii]|uniref:HTH-type transcriptional repressor RspR n=1 Tax=Paracidovorax wautersii TaxID=1177982 RepID=A0A7V8FPP5_9BURK|nr:MAG: HTH-type transcriptional repressor RspR [Paracidovorax wautersii]